MIKKTNEDVVYHEENYSEENLIKFCKYCGSENMEEKVVCYEENIPSEREILCEECGSLINYWSYGFYENDIDEKYKRIILEKKLKRILKKNV